MLIFSRPAAGLMLVAAAAGVYGYERLWPHNPSRPEHASTEATKPPTPAVALATAAPTAPAAIEAPPARMTSAQQAAFEAWLVKTYLACWKPAPQPADADLYVAKVRLAFNPDGSLAKPAKLVNPPSDPALKPQAKSVMAAVQNCNPLPVPAQYRPFYEQWKTKTIHFNPQVAAR
jgi:colicin import membrane protein